LPELPETVRFIRNNLIFQNNYLMHILLDANRNVDFT